MNVKNPILISSVIVILVVLGGLLYQAKYGAPESSANTSTGNTQYSPVIQPSKFTKDINNKFFTLTPGTTFTYVKKTPEGTEQIEVLATGEAKQVMGVDTLVVRDTVRLDGVLVEDTKDWFAQDIDGNVWYFGEAVDNYEGGRLKDHEGSWEAGVDGAMPGIIMPSNPTAGDSYRQEFYRGKAEDMADVIATDKEVAVPYGAFKGCLQTRDWSQIDKSLNEYKFYCPGVAFMTLEESVNDSTQKVELVGVSHERIR